MPVKFREKAVEKSTYAVQVDFTDENGGAVKPNSITWCLTDGSGNIVNSRSNVPVTPATSIDIALSGDDLNITTNGKTRALIIQAVYDSDLGTNLPLNDQAIFEIYDLDKIT